MRAPGQCRELEPPPSYSQQQQNHHLLAAVLPRSLDSNWLTRYAALPYSAGSMAGDIGFDPLQISDLVPLQWAREVRTAQQLRGDVAALCARVLWGGGGRGGDAATLRRCDDATGRTALPPAIALDELAGLPAAARPADTLLVRSHPRRLSSSTRACACSPSPAGSRSTWASACRLRRTSLRSTRTTLAWSAAPCWACSSP